MPVKHVMEGTAIVLGATAIVLIFAPELVLSRLAIGATGTAIPLAQLYGAALFGLAQTFWIARGMMLGGIYGRAIVGGGFAHAFVGVFVLLHALRSSSGNPVVWGACAGYALLALAFGALMFGQGPKAPPDSPAP
jgi:hypothetical protein